MKSSTVLVLAIVAVVSGVCSTGFAISPFKKAFDEKYVKSSDNSDFQAAFKKASCNTCHVKGEKKDVLNAYGLQLADLLEGNAKDRLDAAKEKGRDAKSAEEEKLLKAEKRKNFISDSLRSKL